MLAMLHTNAKTANYIPILTNTIHIPSALIIKKKYRDVFTEKMKPIDDLSTVCEKDG